MAIETQAPATTTATTPAIDAPPEGVLEQAERLRGELRGFAYRMLGSPHDAEDAVQNAMVRAWRSAERFDGRSSVRTWMYRILTNVCLDEISARKRRALPVDLESQASPPVVASLGEPLPASAFVEPVLDSMVGDPADVVVGRDSVRLAFVAALQHLPASQRAVLVLRDVLAWRAAEVAQLLEISVAAANSQLQRARETMAAVRNGSRGARPSGTREVEEDVVARYVAAFERYDMAALATMLAEDAVMSMPPFRLYLAGRDDVLAWLVGPGHECEGSRVLPIEVNGGPGFAQYRRDPDGGHAPWGVHALVVRDGVVAEETVFLGPEIFAALGLPDHLD